MEHWNDQIAGNDMRLIFIRIACTRVGGWNTQGQKLQEGVDGRRSKGVTKGEGDALEVPGKSKKNSHSGCLRSGSGRGVAWRPAWLIRSRSGADAVDVHANQIAFRGPLRPVVVYPSEQYLRQGQPGRVYACSQQPHSVLQFALGEHGRRWPPT